MDNASSPLHWLPDGRTLLELADAGAISLHETKPLCVRSGDSTPSDLWVVSRGSAPPCRLLANSIANPESFLRGV